MHLIEEWLKAGSCGLPSPLQAQNFASDGLQSPLLSQNNGFFQIVNEGIQIHHISSNHWVTSCSFNQEVTIYDSMFTGGTLNTSLTKLLAQIYRLLVENSHTMDVPEDPSEVDEEAEENSLTVYTPLFSNRQEATIVAFLPLPSLYMRL